MSARLTRSTLPTEEPCSPPQPRSNAPHRLSSGFRRVAIALSLCLVALSAVPAASLACTVRVVDEDGTPRRAYVGVSDVGVLAEDDSCAYWVVPVEDCGGLSARDTRWERTDAAGHYEVDFPLHDGARAFATLSPDEDAPVSSEAISPSADSVTIRVKAPAALPAYRPVLDQAESRLLWLTNRERRAHGLSPLEHSRTLSRSADGYARYLTDRQILSHDAYGTPTSRALSAGWPAEGIAENIFACPFVQAVDAWMRSSRHRQNLLDPDARMAGVARAGGAQHDRLVLMTGGACTGDSCGRTGDHGARAGAALRAAVRRVRGRTARVEASIAKGAQGRVSVRSPGGQATGATGPRTRRTHLMRFAGAGRHPISVRFIGRAGWRSQERTFWVSVR